MTGTATLAVRNIGDRAELAFSGRLNAVGVAPLWAAAMEAAAKARGRPLVFDLGGLEFCDMAGATLLAAAEQAHEAPAELRGASEQVRSLVGLARKAATRRPAQAHAVPVMSVRDLLRSGIVAAGAGFTFLGETAVAVARLPARRRMVRGSDFFRYADQAGVRAIPLILLLGFLMGLILAFQSAVPMRQFGAELYVANLVSVSLTRELGPLLAAVILAGRSASAFAAEIGTMKVNEEIDALVTMGLDPMSMLVLPRMAAAVLVMPALTLILDVAGLIGMAVVMVGFGYAMPIIAAQVQYWTPPSDLIQGLAKAAVFGLVIAAIGCRSGLSTGVGPRAVGVSATAAVVGGIVATIVLDGVFAVFFNRLGW
jgi:phospholipid/cholesterol/gamma-HCH transport system permease protein